MITSLRIENFALINETTIRFKDGFTVITGETGSGKSILLNALNLILGERANYSVIGPLKNKSIVEAEIAIGNFGLKRFFKDHELDYFDECIVRREISTQGRSRAFINDTPVQLTTLKALTSQLIHIHSQYNTLELKDVNFQLEVLDVLAGSRKQKEAVENLFSTYQAKKKQLKQKEETLREASSVSDYNAFQLEELQALQLTELDYVQLQHELTSGENVDELKAVYSEVVSVLSDERGVIDLLNSLKASLNKRQQLSDNISSFIERIDSASIDLNDLSDEAENQLEELEVNPQRIEELQEQLNNYNRVLFKHKLTDQSELIQLMDELSSAATNLDGLEEEIARLTQEITKDEQRLKELSSALHQKRLKAIPGIEKTITKSLAELKLVDTQLNFVLTETDQLSFNGMSKLDLLFSPNAGVAPVPVHQAASGGELSRVMLALQSLMSSKTQLQTILFDEIDTGVSGDVAQKVGSTLTKMGQGMQVIAITHLPQVAAKGGQHLKVMKSVVDGRTISKVTELDAQERIEETARLMSGDEINDAALENARALMR